MLGQSCNPESAWGSYGESDDVTLEPFLPTPDHLNWYCWNDLEEDFLQNSGDATTITCTDFHDTMKCPLGAFSSDGYEPCTTCPHHLPHTVSRGSTSSSDCISHDQNLVVMSNFGDKVLSYSRDEESWDIISEEDKVRLEKKTR